MSEPTHKKISIPKCLKGVAVEDMKRIAQSKKKSRRISAELKHINDALIITGICGQFATIGAVSLTLLFCGGMFADHIRHLCHLGSGFFMLFFNQPRTICDKLNIH